jgi:hypothetical protein
VTSLGIKPPLISPGVANVVQALTPYGTSGSATFPKDWLPDRIPGRQDVRSWFVANIDALGDTARVLPDNTNDLEEGARWRCMPCGTGRHGGGLDRPPARQEPEREHAPRRHMVRHDVQFEHQTPVAHGGKSTRGT